ncbi:hypothetical protein TPHA_0L01790 [Tetrapisispora phaffii CBS 4417]|uniref:GDT1 family protein n=1 Tax=Tetrapisispora phaffii (strain ATCC 24235 / CBS 4417 / NBRC 1672 / NRRL Y-8282 / UCD 70-5) TaxID=1071381 RepID=G8C054_TETPH|nr:hypothetical protein TPHA_0L01790 [Tetrapisispora phaffii CBS 4417]CCE65532.1 hypothetical protein TPHA_0L01790 [Tetrapisispora phaffii CBS 4417]
MNKFTNIFLIVSLLLSIVSATATDGSTEDASASKSFIMAIVMIGISEIGDKTFLIAALMAMRSSRWVVFSAAASSLAIMTILSGLAGRSFVAIIPVHLTHFLAGVLFLVFGYKLFKEGLAMSKDAGVDEEMAEVEEELASKDINKKMEDVEAGGSPQGSGNNLLEKLQNKLYELSSYVFSPLWIQIFVMNFLAEFGDRSQISIIAMASDNNYWFTIFGGCIGHFICTALAVIGGKMLATKISMRTMTLGGSISFFVFGLLYIYDVRYMSEER